MPVRSASDPDALAAWRAAFRGGYPFGEDAYMQALSDVGVDLVIAGTGPASGAVVATRRTGPFRQAVVPPLTPYTPLALDPGDDEAAAHRGSTSLVALGDTLLSAFDDVLLHLPPSLHDLRPLQWAGWTVEPRYTYRLDTDAARDPATWSAGPRRVYRQHRDEFLIEETPSVADEVATLCAASYARHRRRPPLPADAMTALARHMIDDGSGRAFLARDREGGAVAGVAILVSGGTGYYWMAGSIPGPGMTVLMGTVLDRLADGNVGILDLVGANTPSIAEFKRRFNPDLIRYHAARKTSSGAFRIARALRRMIFD